MVTWFLVATALLLLARLPFVHADIITFYVEFQPGIVLVPLAGVFWGPAGALGVLAASLIGDWLYGLWGPLSAFRAVGLFLFSYSAKHLWDYLHTRERSGRGLTPHWGQTMRFLLISWPGCFLAASWPAVGAEYLRLYPFPYIVALLLTHHLIFTTLLAPALYRILARELVPYFGCWREVLQDIPSRPLSPLGARLHVLGGLGACVAGILGGGVFYRMWPTRASVLGTYCGWGLLVLVVPFLILQIGGLLLQQSPQESIEESPRRLRVRRVGSDVEPALPTGDGMG